MVVIVFQESSGAEDAAEPNLAPIKPGSFKSYFNHVIFVVRKDHTESKVRGNTVYRYALISLSPSCLYFHLIFFSVEVVAKQGVEEFTPGLPVVPLFNKDATFRDFLLTKSTSFFSHHTISTLLSNFLVINAERASYSAPGFAAAFARTREQLLREVLKPYMSDKSHSSNSAWS